MATTKLWIMGRRTHGWPRVRFLRVLLYVSSCARNILVSARSARDFCQRRHLSTETLMESTSVRRRKERERGRDTESDTNRRIHGANKETLRDTSECGDSEKCTETCRSTHTYTCAHAHSWTHTDTVTVTDENRHTERRRSRLIKTVLSRQIKPDKSMDMRWALQIQKDGHLNII